MTNSFSWRLCGAAWRDHTSHYGTMCRPQGVWIGLFAPSSDAVVQELMWADGTPYK